MNPEIAQMAHAVAAALVNGIYQGLVLAGVLWLGLKLSRGSNAATRHAVSFVALIVVALLPLFHLVASRVDGEPPVETVEPGHALKTVAASPLDSTGASLPETPIHNGDEPAGFPDYAKGKSPVSELDSPGEAAIPEAYKPVIAADIAQQIQAEPTANSTAVFQRPAIKYLKANLPAFGSVILVGLIVFIGGARLLRLGVQFIALARLKRNGTMANDAVAAVFSNVLAESPAGRSVRVGVSDRIHAPMAIGYVNPVVLLPANLIETAEAQELEGVLRHELAHIQRGDDWFNLVQQGIAAVCFFNPSIWWLSKRLTTDREIACDDHALAKSRSPQDYAMLLTEFAGRSRGNDWIAAPAAWSSRSQLKERITMILDSKRNTSSRLARTSATALTLATIATATVALLAGPRLVLGASADKPAEAEPSATSVHSIDTIAETPSLKQSHAADPFGSASSYTVTTESSDAKPKISRSRSTITLQNGDAIITAPVEVETVVESNVDVADGHHRIVVAHGAPPAEAPPKVRPPKGPKPTPLPPAAPSADFQRHPAPSDQGGESLERRLERLERQIEKLTSGNPFHSDHPPGELETETFVWKEKSKDKAGEPGAFEIHEENVFFTHPEWPMDEEQQKVVQKAVKDAEAQIAKAMKEAERAARSAQQHARITRERISKGGPGVEQQRKALEQQRRSLEKQMENLDRQMDRLDDQMDRLDDHLEEQIDELEEIEENVNVNVDPQDFNRESAKVKEKQ